MEKLYGLDYFSKTYFKLTEHPDFDLDAFKIIIDICMMDNEQIKALNVNGGNFNG